MRSLQKSMFLMVLVLNLFCITTSAWAVSAGAFGFNIPETPSTLNPAEVYTKIIDEFSINMMNSGVQAQIWDYALRFFGIIVIIQLTWSLLSLAMSGEMTLLSFVSLIFRQAVTIGFFWMLLTMSPSWLQLIIDSLKQLGAYATGMDSSLAPGDLFAQGFAISSTLWAAAGITEKLAVVFPCLFIMVLFSMAATLMAVTIIQGYFVVIIAIFMIAFSATDWTRETSIKGIMAVVSVGFKLFIMAIIIGVLNLIIEGWVVQIRSPEGLKNLGGSVTAAMLMSGASVIFFGLLQSLPELAAGLVGISGPAPLSSSITAMGAALMGRNMAVNMKNAAMGYAGNKAKTAIKAGASALGGLISGAAGGNSGGNNTMGPGTGGSGGGSGNQTTDFKKQS